MPRQEAFRLIHFPDSLEQEERARQRLAYQLESGLRAKVAGAPPDPNPERFLEALGAAKART